MIHFYQNDHSGIFAVGCKQRLGKEELEKLAWLFGNASLRMGEEVEGYFIGPRKEMITPWSTNAVEITQNMGIGGIERIEEFVPGDVHAAFDPMLQRLYKGLDQEIFHIEHRPEPIREIENIAEYNREEGLALSEDEVEYLEEIGRKLGRRLTDSEVYGFAQVNSEHCRHKIFNGTFNIDGQDMSESLFSLIKKTSVENPNLLVSAYKDNVAFIEGPVIEEFAPGTQDTSDFFRTRDILSVISLKAETHNFPTTVEPFNGASTGTGGEIRDRLAGGKASIPLAGTAVYMTSYPRLEAGRKWEEHTRPRPWLYQSPAEILIKASNGASDFGNKFGQPLICGSVLTFEYAEHGKEFGFDKVIMLAGGIGFGLRSDSMKDLPGAGDLIVVMGGDNYRIGMGGGAVSSVATGEYGNHIELNAVQRANPEMQKRVYNAIRAMAESGANPIVSIHDHGAGGHLNSLSELVETTGGTIEIGKLPLGDPTLSDKEIIGNESQERMGLIIREQDLPLLERVAARERAPLYVVGKTTGDHVLRFINKYGQCPIDLNMEYLFGKPPKTLMEDHTVAMPLREPQYELSRLTEYLRQLLQMEAVACKDWLTNKVDRSVTGKIAKQQCAGAIQLPLNNLGVAALDYIGSSGVATTIGHAPVAGLADPAGASVLAVAEALTNLVWAPLTHGLKGVSLSANWMWPSKNPGEDVRLYQAVKSASDFSIALGINIPTGKDSLSMTQKYPRGEKVFAPGTVIISAVAEVSEIRKVVEPVLRPLAGSELIYVELADEAFGLGGSSFGQLMNAIGNQVPAIQDPAYFLRAFGVIQTMVKEGCIRAGHDVSAGGLITTLLEMTFGRNDTGMELDLSGIPETDLVKLLFSEKPGLVIQVDSCESVNDHFILNKIRYFPIGQVNLERKFSIKKDDIFLSLDADGLRDTWYRTSYLLDRQQSGPEKARERYEHYAGQELSFHFPDGFAGTFESLGLDLHRKSSTGLQAAIIREKGVNGDREMAWMMHLAGFDVKDVHMTDLISGRETLEDIHFIVFVGGFSNSDVLGSARGWAGAFLYNPRAKKALDNFYARQDTLSLGICNGCQLMVGLGLVYPEHSEPPKMLVNASGKFESAFLNVNITENKSVMLKSLAGARLGIWVAHGEGRFALPYDEGKYHIPVKFSYDTLPGNPNGSDFNTAAICSHDGRHLVMMPHLERAIFPWNWAFYPYERKFDEVSPWILAFVNAREWVEQHAGK